jgi:hypothetical protein
VSNVLFTWRALANHENGPSNAQLTAALMKHDAIKDHIAVQVNTKWRCASSKVSFLTAAPRRGRKMSRGFREFVAERFLLSTYNQKKICRASQELSTGIHFVA